MNRLISTEYKYIDHDSQSQKRILPIAKYDKIYKLLRNLIIHSSSVIEHTQIEVYVQNSDAFMDVISNSLKYMSACSSQGVVPYHLISLLVQLIEKITDKSKVIMIPAPIPQFLNIFGQLFDILKNQNQFDLWLQTMQQF